MADFDFTKAPVEFSELDSENGKKWNAQCSPLVYDEGFIKLGKEKGVFAKNYVRYYEKIRDFQVFPDDVWVVSFPKCGTTWVQEMVWCIANDLDFYAAKVEMSKRFPFFESRAHWSPAQIHRFVEEQQKSISEKDKKSDEKSNEKMIFNPFDSVESMPRRRFIKSHLHYSLLPQALRNSVFPTAIKTDSPKIIYVTRNPKDACTSFYHHNRLLVGYRGNLDDFVDAFTTDNVAFGPYFTHLREFWEVRDCPNVLFLKYEDMKDDLPKVIKQTASFLGRWLSEDQTQLLAKHISFEKMKNNPAVNYESLVENTQKTAETKYDSKFMRKGQVGSWKEEMTPEKVAKFDAWIAQNKIEGLYDS